MNAQEAARLAVLEQARRDTERVRKNELEEARQKREREDNFDFWKGLVLKRIAAAVMKGERSTTWDGWDNSVAEYFKKEGYRVEYYSGTANMGDSGAPCMVEYEGMELKW